MALSAQKSYTNPAWPLGYVNVPANGTPVCIMFNIDPANTNSGNTPTGNNSTEYTRACRAISFQGVNNGGNNNGMIFNTGNVYVLVKPAGGTGNRADSGSMLKVIPPGGDYVLSAITPGVDMFSPYSIFIDTDNNNEGALVTLYGAGNP